MSLTNGHEPRFDLDFAYGREGEEWVQELLSRRGLVEVKRKRRVDDYYYVETEQNSYRRGEWKPSGLAVTESEWWAYVVADCRWVVFWQTDTLRRAVAHSAARQVGEDDGDNPTRGFLINGQLLRQLAKEDA